MQYAEAGVWLETNTDREEKDNRRLRVDATRSISKVTVCRLSGTAQFRGPDEKDDSAFSTTKLEVRVAIKPGFRPR